MVDLFWMSNSCVGHLVSSIRSDDRQQSIWARCVHPTGTFERFRKEELEQSITDRFEEQASRYSDRLAVKSRNCELTYDSLNRLANRIARAILARSGQGSKIIALLLEDDAPVIAAIFGVLKTGMMYVPLDPTFPRARIAYMLEDSQAGFMVTNNRNFPLAVELSHDRNQLLNIDELGSGLSDENLSLSISPDTCAYILYTSGSTGKPKGVVENHRNILYETMTTTNHFHICAEDRQTLLRSVSYTGAARDIYSALLNGASVSLFHIEEQGMANLADWMIQEGITIYRSVATTFRNFMSTLTGEEEFPGLRAIHTGGEPIYRRDVELYKRCFSADCILIFGLGLTESGTVCVYFMDRDTEVDDRGVPVGYPVEDTEILLLNDAGKGVDFGQIGEISVRNRYISPGYWRRQELTRATFLPDPEDSDKRIYRTGDLGIMLPDGCLFHLGRKDSQVKIRGHRVEIGEVETALLDLDAIKEAVVLAKPDRYGDQRLVAYLVPIEQPGPNVSIIRRALAEKLPVRMLPSAYVMLDTLPHTLTGKIDRRSLPDPDTARPELGSPFIAPRTPVEKTLAGIWAQVLGLDEVGAQDSFLDLGGHSLLATQIISRVTRAFRVKFSLQSLFQSPTIADMAVTITQRRVEETESGDVKHMLAELEALSDEEVQKLLAEEDIGGNSSDE